MRTMPAIILSVALGGATFVSAAFAQQIDKATFEKQVAVANTFEIQSSKLALDKADSSDVKAFAEQMIADHTKAGEEFKAAVQQAGDTPPPEELDAKHADIIAKLEGASGKDFDAAYVEAQHNAHVEAVNLFSTYAAQPDDEALGAFAKKTLPTLEGHLEHVKKLDETH
jgi:putative membrane protein